MAEIVQVNPEERQKWCSNWDMTRRFSVRWTEMALWLKST